MATKPGKVVTYDDGNSPMMSHDPLTMNHLRSHDKLKA